jgi:hypothetical protein
VTDQNFSSASTEQFVLNTWSINYATNIVIAISVDNIWFEGLDIPVRLKGKLPFPPETVQRLTVPPLPAVPPLASASSGQVTINSWSVYDPTIGPIFPPPPATIIRVSHWLGQSEPQRIRQNKAAFASADPIMTGPAPVFSDVIHNLPFLATLGKLKSF